jgi:hypothetical protein
MGDNLEQSGWNFIQTIKGCFYLFGSSDQTNNGSEISDPDAVNCKCRKVVRFFEAVTSFYMYTNAEKFTEDHCVKMLKWQAH